MKMIIYILIAAVAATTGSEIHHAINHPQPYKFGYTVKDKEGSQHREEAGNGAGVVQGNYGYTDSKGIHRHVDYVADHAGFRAHIKTNEPGTANESPAAVHMVSQAIHGFPSLYGPRAYHHMPAHDRHIFITPVHGHDHMSHHMPVHHEEVHMPVHHSDHHHQLIHVPVHHEPLHVPVHQSYHEPLHMPVHHSNHHEQLLMPVHHSDQHMPVHVPLHHMPVPMPVHEHVVPHHIPVHGHAAHMGHGGNFGINLKGGVVKGYDSRNTHI